jgi:hypothetical protein
MFFIFTFPIFLMMPLNNPGLVEAKDISGTYLLSGVPETAAGFRFMPDSTFEFFFSYGAMDRSASGTYTQKDNSLVLTGNKIPGKDFAITKSSKKGTGITLQVNNPNEILKREIICVFYKEGQPELLYTDEKGMCNYPGMADSIQLVHPLYPDENTVLLPSTFPASHNYIELSLEPSLEQLCFLKMPIEIRDNTFTCQFAWLSGEKKYTFYKSEGGNQ